MLSPGKMSRLYQTLHNVLKTYKEWNYLANSTYDGDTITSASGRKTNGREHSKHADFSNQK